MSAHQHPKSKAALRAHKADVRALEAETAKHLDRLYALARRSVLMRLDVLLQQMQAERKRLQSLRGIDAWDEGDEEDEERPRIALSWLIGNGRLTDLTAHVARDIDDFARMAGQLITQAHHQATVRGAAAAAAVLTHRRSPDDASVTPLPAGTLTALAGRAGNGQPVASLLDGLGADVAGHVAKVVQAAVQVGTDTPHLRKWVDDNLSHARHRAQTVLTDSLWRANGDAMMAVYRANGSNGRAA